MPANVKLCVNGFVLSTLLFDCTNSNSDQVRAFDFVHVHFKVICLIYKLVLSVTIICRLYVHFIIEQNVG